MATSTPTSIPSSEQIYENIQKELVAATRLSNQLSSEISFLNDQVQIFSDQLTMTKTDYLYVKGLEKQIATLNAALGTYLSVLDTTARPKVLTAVEQQVAAASDLLVTVYKQVQIVAQSIYQAMVNLNVVIEAIFNTQELLANYNSSQKPTNIAGNPTTLPPNSALAPALTTAMNAGLGALQDLTNMFLEFINFMLLLKGLIGSTHYLSQSLVEQQGTLQTLVTHLAYRFRNDVKNETELTRLLRNAQAKLNFTKERYAATQMDINLLQVESAAAIASLNVGTIPPALGS